MNYDNLNWVAGRGYQLSQRELRNTSNQLSGEIGVQRDEIIAYVDNELKQYYNKGEIDFKPQTLSYSRVIMCILTSS